MMPFDLQKGGVLVADVGFPDDPVGRVNANDDRGTIRHLVVAPTEDAIERDANRDGLDARDQRARSNFIWLSCFQRSFLSRAEFHMVNS